MSDRYFKLPSIEIEGPKEVKPVDTDDIPDISEAIKVIQREIQRIQDGTSDLRTGAMQFPKGEIPATVSLLRLIERPGKKNLKTFLACAHQDFGMRVTEFFIDEISKSYLEIFKLDVPKR